MILKMKLLPVVILLCMLYTIRGDAESEQQVRLEDIEHDNLLSERQKHSDAIVAQQTQHIKAPSILAPHHFQQSFEDEGPQDIFVTPPPDVIYADKSNQPSFYHLPKVHEADRTHPAASRQSLITPNIGGHYPIANYLNPQPQYVYVQAATNQQPVNSFYQPHQPVHQHYIQQSQPYVMVPSFASHYGQQYHHQLPPQAPTPSVFSFGPSSAPQTYPLKSSVEYAEPSAVAPLQSSVEYANKNVAQIQYKKPTTTFQQYYSPGVEYHYTETVPNTKLAHQAPYHYETPHHYHQQHSIQPIQHSIQPQSYNHQQPFLNYYQSPSGFKHHDTGLLDSYVPSLVTYARQQQLKNLFQPNIQHHHSIQPHSIQQNLQHSYPHLQSQIRYQPYPSAPAYNTIAYSVKLPPYDHSKRSIAKATAVKT